MTWVCSGRRKSYRAAFRVEQYRAAAQELRRDDPETYWRIVEQATGSDAEAAARRDPDAFAALFLAEARDAGVIKGEARSVEGPKSDRDYWPHLDLQGVLDCVADFFAQNESARGGPLTYPGWAVRRYVAFEVLREAGLSEPKINSDLSMLFSGRAVMDEDPLLDEGVEGLLRLHHLEEPVDVVVDALTDRAT